MSLSEVVTTLPDTPMLTLVFICLCKKRCIFEPFLDHSLDTSTSCDLDQLLDSHFSDKVLEKCSTCTAPIKQTISLWGVPDCFIINLKRYNNYGHLNDKLIQFPFTLDLTRHFSPDKKDPNNYICHLYAINYYIGNSTGNNGHYYSACKNLQGKWYIYDDSDVKSVQGSSTLVTKHAYILFYYRERIL